MKLSMDPQTGTAVPLYPVAYIHPGCEGKAVARGRYGYAIAAGEMSTLDAKLRDKPPASDGS